MIEQLAPDFYNPDWQISLSQYKAWIALITLQEAGDHRYHAHSTGSPGIDVFYHQNPAAGKKFPFSTGLGPFQLDRCKGPDCVDNWGVWPTIDKLDPGKSLQSVLKWHFNKFGPGTTLEDFSLQSRWCSVRLVPTGCKPKDNGLSMKENWQKITHCKWEDCKSKKMDVDFKPPFVDDPFSNTVKELGKLSWNVEGLQGSFDTWLICASGPGIKWAYYYTFNEDSGKEFWVWKDPQGKLIYRYTRNYKEGPLPEGVKNNRAGVTDKEGALQVPPNSPPTANAGPDQIMLVNSVVQLDGSGSSDPDDCTIKYLWKFIKKPNGSKAKLSKSNIPKPTFKADKVGDYVLELTVDDGRGGTATDQVTITAGKEVCKFKREIYWIGQPPEGVSQTLIDPPTPPADASVRFSLCIEETQDAFRWVYTVYNLDFRTQEGINGLSGLRIENTFSVPFSNQFGPPRWVMQGFTSEWEWDIPSGQGIPKGGSAQFGFVTAKDVGPTQSDCCYWVHSWNSVPLQVDVLGGGQMLIPAPLAAAASQAASAVGVSSIGRGYSFGLMRESLGVKDFSVIIFDLSGKLVFRSDWVQNGFTWNFLDNRGQPLANGVYLYVITYRREDGTILRSEVKKLVILR
jgi:hypothetical protein